MIITKEAFLLNSVFTGFFLQSLISFHMSFYFLLLSCTAGITKFQLLEHKDPFSTLKISGFLFFLISIKVFFWFSGYRVGSKQDLVNQYPASDLHAPAPETQSKQHGPSPCSESGGDQPCCVRCTRLHNRDVPGPADTLWSAWVKPLQKMQIQCRKK